MSTSQIVMHPASVRSADGAIEVIGRVEDPDGVTPFSTRWIGTRGPDDLACGDAMLCFGLVPAMVRGIDLHIAGPVSRSLLFKTETIQEILARWYPNRFRPVAIAADRVIEVSPSPQPAVAGFFTGGVDSLFTLREREVSALIYVQGFETTFGDTERIDPAHESGARAAKATGKRFLEVTSDVRSYLDRHTNWLTDTNVAALAGIGHLLSAEIGTVIVSSSNSFDRLSPLGCDPLLDPLWSSERLRIEPFGSHCDRPQKLAAIAGWDVAQETLRVCGNPDSANANCGRCEKCVRTFLGLMALGVSESFAGRFESVPSLADARTVAIDVSRHTSWFDWIAMRESLDGRPLSSEQDLVREVLGERIHEYERRRLTRKLRPHVSDVVRCPYWTERWPKFRRKVLRSIAESDPDWLRARVRKHLPELREAFLEALAADPAWLKRKLRRARWRRLMQRLHLVPK